MAFPTNPSPGDSYTDEYGTVWIYAGTVNGWYRQTVTTPNDTSYTAAISGPAGSNTQVQFNDNGELAGDSGLTYNKTTDALSGGAFIPTGNTVPSNGLYLPSANNVALSTNGTERLRITSAGLVGIGTSVPSSQLSVSASGVNGLHLARQTDNGVNSGRLFFESSADIWTAYTTTGTFKIASGATIGTSSGTDRLVIDSSGRLLVGTSTDSGGALLQINGNRIRIATAKTPASATDTGVAGEVCWDSSYIYVCTATNTWKRAALATW